MTLKIKLTKKLLNDLYWSQNLSPYKIGDIYGCSFSTITNRFKEFGIPFKSSSLSRQKYTKKDFSGNKCEKAYMIGFRIGDLNVYKTSDKSEFIIARCHTTCSEQLKLIVELFEKYGKVTISKSGHINCFLNNSFAFLLEKYNHYKKITQKKEFFAFVAGYLDAEGYLGINQGKARLKVDSYDEEVLKWISKKLEIYGIRNKCRMIGICKTNRNLGMELWRININWAADLYRFINKIKPYSKHLKRINQMKVCQLNIMERSK